jgi:hypothetical protein
MRAILRAGGERAVEIQVRQQDVDTRFAEQPECTGLDVPADDGCNLLLGGSRGFRDSLRLPERRC